MATITFENGKKVNFEGTPTQQDIEEVAQTLGITKKKSTLRKVGDFFTKGTQKFAETLGTAASVIDPKTKKLREETIAKTNEQVDLLLQQARKETDKDKAKRILEATRKLAETEGVDIFNRPEYQKTAKQVLGEALETGLEIASFGTFGAGQIPTALKVLKPGQKILKSTVSGAKVGAGFGGLFGVSEALQQDKSGLQIAGAGLLGAGTGGLFGGLLGGTVTGGTQGINAIISRASKLTNQGKKLLGEAAYNKLLQTSRDLVKMSPTASKNEAKWNKNTPEFLANEFIIDEKTLKPKSILQLIDSDGRRLENTEAINALRKKYNEESRAFNSLLKDSGEYVSLNNFKTKSLNSLDDLKSRGTDYDDAVRQLNREINAYSKNFKDRGIVDGDDLLIKIDDFNKIKSGLWAKTSNFNPNQADKLLSDVSYRMGQTAKDMIEDTVQDTAVKKMNQRLGDFASAINVLEKAQGKVVPGGFFGRQLTRIAGTIAGTPGGVAGSLLGNITGGVLADLAANPKIKTTLWSKIVSQIYKQKGGQSIIDDAVKILQKRGQQRASIKLVEAPKFIPLTPKSGASGLMSQDEAQKLINELRKIDPNILPKGKGEILKSKLSKQLKYKTTINIQDKNDLDYLRRILSEDNIRDIKSGKMTNFRGTPYEDLARVNIISKTPKTTADDALINEAKKYKSAEEFVNENSIKHISQEQVLPKKQGDIQFYHGTDVLNYDKLSIPKFEGSTMDRNYGDYFYITPDRSLTETYGRYSAGFNIPKEKVLPLEKYRSLWNAEKGTGISEKAFDDKLFKDYWAIEMPDNEFIVKDVSKIRDYTKSQLTDIWNKAHKNKKLK